MSDDGPDYSKTRNGLAEAARVLDGIRDRTQNERDREALRAGAQLLRIKATEPDSPPAGTMYCPRCQVWVTIGDTCGCGFKASLPLPPERTPLENSLLGHVIPGSHGKPVPDDGPGTWFGLMATLAGEIAKAAKSLDEQTRAMKRLTDAVNRSTNSR